MSEQKKIYIGNGKPVGSNGIKIGINLTKLAQEGKDFIRESNGNKWISAVLWANANGADQYGNTHSLQIDTWKPDPTKAAAKTPAPVAAPAPAKENPKTFTAANDDLPF